MIYLSIFFLYIFGVLSIDKKYFYHFSLLCLCFAMIFLPPIVGINSDRADFSEYLKFFTESPNLFSENFFEYAKSQHTELGYNYFQAFCKTFFHSASVFFIIFCFTSFLFRLNFYNKFVSEQDIILCFLAFFSHEFLRKDCVQIRNGFASAIVLFSLYYLYKNKKLKFVLWILIASLFQSTALVALPLVIAKTENSKKYFRFLKILFFVALILTLAFPIKNLLFVMEKVGILPANVANYLYWSEYAKSMSLFNPQILRQFFITAFFFIHSKRYFDDKKIFFLFQIYLVSTVYYLVFRDFEILAGRFGSLFYAVETPMILLAINKSKHQIFFKKILLMMFYACFLILNFLTYSALGFKATFY